MEKLRVNKDVYRIEVNDNGEYIEFDLLDIDLPMKLMNGAESLKKEERIYRQKSNALRKQYKDKELYVKMYDLDRDYCNKLRNIFDSFLGEGACQKIFGNTNRINMFNDFMEQLEPHLDKMELNIQGIKEKLYNKYISKDKKVL